MSRQTLTIQVTRKEFLKLPMAIRRRALKKMAEDYVKRETSKCWNDRACRHGISHDAYCAQCEGGPLP